MAEKGIECVLILGAAVQAYLDSTIRHDLNGQFIVVETPADLETTDSDVLQNI